jgi:hypothetical protein
VLHRPVEPASLFGNWLLGFRTGRVSVSENPVYKVVGAVKRHSKFCEPGVESRASREAGVHRQQRVPDLEAMIESDSEIRP